MNPAMLVELGWKSVILAVLALGLLALVQRRSAAEKSIAADAGLLMLLLLPVTMPLLPGIEIAAPPLVEATVTGLTIPEATAGGVERGSPSASGVRIGWSTVTRWAYFVPALGLLLALLVSLVRLHLIYRRASVVEDARWLTAMAAAQNRIGVKHGTALLVSDEINSPISWGIIRPVIMLDPTALLSADRAEAIIAHELAHVHRHDWVKLVAARLAVAVFWFNPLVWLLSRRCHQLREEAADDAVLRARIGTADYAKLLVTSVRHANAAPFLAANGVAPSKSSLSFRVMHILDPARPRTPARAKWAAVSLALALMANAALAAAEPVLVDRNAVDATAGERAARQLSELPSLHSRTLGIAIARRDWERRRTGGGTTFNDPAAVAPLLLATRDDHAAVRRIAVWALSEMRPSVTAEAEPRLTELLSDSSASVRAAASSALGDLASLDASGPLQHLVENDPNAAVRRSAAHALGDIQDPESRATLAVSANDADAGVRAEAQWALKRVLEAERLLSR